MTSIILHSFDASPFAEKVRLTLGLKGLSWKSVQAELVMPKPNLTVLTGGYRKTPVMQIGADVYCDSRFIIEEIEDRFPSPSLFPGGSRVLCMTLSGWSDRELHFASSGLAMGHFMNTQQFPQDLLDDRKTFFEGILDVNRLGSEIPHLSGQLRAHANLIEQQLADGRRFWLGDVPSLADFHAYVEVRTARSSLPFADKLFDGFGKMEEWEARVKAIGHGERTDIDVEEAHKEARDGEPQPGRGVTDGDLLGLVEGDSVIVTPDDYGKEPVMGRLVTLTVREVAIARQDPVLGRMVIHFPRIGYRLTKQQQDLMP